MTARTPAPGLSARRLRTPALVAAAVTLAMVGARLLAAHDEPLAWVRASFSLAALATILFARKANFARRAMLALALEATGGFLAFTYVDVPFIVGHRTQIANVALALEERFAPGDAASASHGFP